MQVWFNMDSWSRDEVRHADNLGLWCTVDATDAVNITDPQFSRWCGGNLGGALIGDDRDGRVTLFFEKEQDAILFKLRFVGGP